MINSTKLTATSKRHGNEQANADHNEGDGNHE